MSDDASKPNLEDVLAGKTEVLPESSKTGEQVVVTSTKPRITEPVYLKGETVHSGGTIYDGSEPVFAKDDGSVEDATAPPPPATYDLNSASMLSYLLPVIGPFIVLGAVGKDNKDQRFVALQALVLQFIAFLVLSVLFGIAGLLGSTDFILFKLVGGFFKLLGMLLGFIFVCAGFYCAIGGRQKPVRLPFVSILVDSQIK